MPKNKVYLGDARKKMSFFSKNVSYENPRVVPIFRIGPGLKILPLWSFRWCQKVSGNS